MAFPTVDPKGTALKLAITTLEQEAKQLRDWAIESMRGGWSTHQVNPQRQRADEIDSALYEIRMLERESERA